MCLADFSENVIKPIPIHINNHLNLGMKVNGGESS